MCGISGKLYFNQDGVVVSDVIRRMNAALAHPPIVLEGCDCETRPPSSEWPNFRWMDSA